MALGAVTRVFEPRGVGPVPPTESVLPSGITLRRATDAGAMPAAFGTPLPDHVLERIGLHWAARRQVPPDRVIMDEKELGYGIWAPGRPAQYFDFIDKVTGRVVAFTIPDHLDQQYARQLEHEQGLLPRPGYGGPEVDPPALVAEASVDDGQVLVTARAVSARTGPRPRLHPLVTARLSAIPPAARVRGAERHAELVALSAALTDADARRAAAGRPPIDWAGAAGRPPIDEAGAGGRPPIDPAGAGGQPRIGLSRQFRIRQPGDPLAGAIGSSCATCAQVFGRPEPGNRALTWHRRTADRFHLHRDPGRPPAGVIDRVAAVAGVRARHEPFPAAVAALTRYLGKSWHVEEPGRTVRTSAFAIDPLAVADSADTLARVAGPAGAPLFPLGPAGLDGILAIAADGRVLLIDDAGEWLLGAAIRPALDTLVLGMAADRLR
jgi:hypothetical protein